MSPRQGQAAPPHTHLIGEKCNKPLNAPAPTTFYRGGHNGRTDCPIAGADHRRALETFAAVSGNLDPHECLAALHELEDADVRSGVYAAFDGASELLRSLPTESWALVTSNYEHRVRGRFLRTGLPVPSVIVDAATVEEGKPSPVPYLRAAARLGAEPEDCLVIEDAPSGVQSGLQAGMTVWGVNAAVAVEGVHRHFDSLREAVPHILAFVSGPHGYATA
ncbi:hypothetical protein Sliba_79010 [Streptomyces nigrescens]|uniref:Phosphatase n=1 Tax=Streptomyces nigrescens TaxID=1920 RepID=A0A640TUY3_STRNI|nr:hypothetical protein Sliba_79010 [Streptomyces libani subsp. libani]GGV96111.1 hypothetical protein GCM10010500_38060 [Streptomyces libani subsp. libani]